MTELPETHTEIYYRLVNEAHHASLVIDHFDHLPGSEPIFQRLQAERDTAHRALIEHVRDNAEAILGGL